MAFTLCDDGIPSSNLTQTAWLYRSELHAIISADSLSNSPYSEHYYEITMEEYALQIDQPPRQQDRRVPQVRCSSVLLQLVWASFCPCIPAAQIASAVGRSYWVAFASFFLFFFGGILCYGVSMTMRDPVFEWEYTITPFLAAWGMYILGPWATVLFNSAILTFIYLEPSMADDASDSFDYGISATAVTLALIHSVAQIAQIQDAVRLRKLLRQRVQIKSLLCQSICCPLCSLAHTAATVKTVTDAGMCNVGPLDELPAYL